MRFALLAGAGAAAAVAMPMDAHAQDQAADDLATVVVTGSRIRRVDAETANPVMTLGTEDIQRSGATTLGELILEIPSISGAATNPSVNNGGGDGATNVELRGLGVERTLVLLNGRRIGALGQTTNAVDVNMIPVNMIERVDVLKEGAGAIYGSDAIGGVINFITRTEMDGAEIGVDYGVSGEDDGERRAISLTWGASSDRANIIFGVNYNQQDAISAADRAFSRNAIYFYGSVFEGGSSRAPNGRISLDPALEAQFGCSSVTLVDGAPGTSLADYRCFVTTGDNNDFYNYQPLNLILTPTERGNLFTMANFDLTDDIELYSEVLFNYTTSGFEIAPLPFDARSDNVVIPANNIYNPFGIALGGSAEPLNPNALWRLEALGNRRSKVDTYQGQINIGLRGALFDTGWNWDASFGYGRLDQDLKIDGYLFKPALVNAFGPSFIGADGPTCGTPAEPIPNCTPVNIFNLSDPAQIDALGTIAAGYNQSYKYYMRSTQLNLDGDLFELPAGPVLAAVGFEYREQALRFDTDSLTQAQAPLFKDCQLAGETCSGDSRGSYDVSDLYAEVFVPILNDVPGAESLSVTLGARYSDYSTFGDTTNGVYKIEWRPISDLLVRATLADVFRAPTLNDLYRGPTANAATFNDPCVGLTAAMLGANPNLALACQNVVPDGTFEQANSQVDGLFEGSTFLGGYDLKPEEGDVLTYGLVYDPSWAPGLSMNVQFWDYEIENIITSVDVNTTAEQCAATGSPFFCGFINRFSDGQILQILQPTVNLGKLETNGIDAGISYRLPGTGSGDWRFSIDSTYTDSYESTPIAGGTPVEIAGTYDRQYGNYAQWRATAQVGWAMGPFEALVVGRWIDSIELNDPDGAPGVQPALQVPSVTYVDLTLGYTLDRTNTKFQLGVNNLTDEDPPILYQNNVLNANTDVSTYDTIGRFFFGSIVQKF